MALSPRAREIFGGGSATIPADVAKKSDLAAKADTTYVDAELAKKAATSAVTAKADKTYVDTELGKKANATDVAAKADKTYVDTQLGGKVDKTTYTTDMGNKMNKNAKVVTGASISGNTMTFTFADGTTSTVTLPASGSGTPL